LKAKSILLNSLRGYRASYSQAGQDAWVAQEVFNEEKGLFFVEAGAYDGIGFSKLQLVWRQTKSLEIFLARRK
jgi:hypothetical protein